MQVQCPGCSKVLNAPDKLAGRVIKCPGCGCQMQLPGAEASAAAPVPEPEAPPSGPAGRSGSTGAGGSSAPAPAGGSTVPCPYCREQIQKGAVKCRHCGEILDARHRRQRTEAARLVSSYQIGMRGMSVGLVILAGFILLVGLLFSSLIFGMTGESEEGAAASVGIIVVFGGIAAVMLVLGVCAWMLQHWVNWVMGGLCGLFVLLGIAAVIMTGQFRGVVGSVIELAFLFTAISNIKKHGRIVAAGADPRAPAQRRGKAKARPRAAAKGKPYARSRR